RSRRRSPAAARSRASSSSGAPPGAGRAGRRSCLPACQRTRPGEGRPAGRHGRPSPGSAGARPGRLGDRSAGDGQPQPDRAVRPDAELVRAGRQLPEDHRGPRLAAGQRPGHHAGVHRRVAGADRAGLDLGTEQRGRDRDDRGPDVAADVEQHRGTPAGVRVVLPVGVHGYAAGVPGRLWNPPAGAPTYGKWSVTAAAGASGVNVGSTSGIVAPATARSSTVTTSSSSRRPFGKPAGSPAISPSTFGAGVGGIARLSRSRSACTGPVKFWKPGTTPAGIPVSRIAARSARGLVYAASFGNTPG